LVEYLLAGSSGSRDGSDRFAFFCTQPNKFGSTISVVTDEKISPPMTAWPKGATCSPPSPKPEAIGIIPATMAIVVIKIGLNLEDAAHFAAWPAEKPNSLRQYAA